MKIEEKEIVLKTGEILKLFSPVEKHAEELAEHFNKIVCETNFLASGIESGFKTAEDELAWLERMNPSENNFIVSASVDGKIVGLGNLNCKSKNPRLKHISCLGVSVQKEYWGKGIAKAIMTELVDNAEKLGYEQIELEVVKDNASAINLYTKFGFVKTGVHEKGMKYSDGTYADLLFMVKYF